MTVWYLTPWFPCRFSLTECIFSPDDRLVLTGTSLNRGDTCAKLYMFSRNGLDLVREMDVPSHVVKVHEGVDSLSFSEMILLAIQIQT